VSLAKVERKLDIAAAAIQLYGRKFRITVAAMRPDNVHVLAEVVLAKPPHDNKGANCGDVAGVIAAVLHLCANFG
jgi:hypothetical protein